MKTAFELFEAAVADKSAPFVFYSKPRSSRVTGIFAQSDHVCNTTESDFNSRGFVFAPFSGEHAILIPEHTSYVVTEDYDTSYMELSAPEQPAIDALAKANFESLVARSIEAIKSGSFEKLVCSRTERVVVRDLNIVAAFKRMLHAYPNAFRYCFYHPACGFWMGATPEQLLKANGDIIQTVALAGTQLFKEGQEAAWAAKEQQEQKFVTDYILGELEPYVSDTEVTAPYTHRAGNIVHIKTDIKARHKTDATLKEIINALHPTPAVCGLPKENAKQFLLENEGYNREYYSGFLGELNYDFATGQEGRTDLFVNLRCMKVKDNTAQLFIGCGVTKDSNPENEYIETVNKSMTMRRIL